MHTFILHIFPDSGLASSLITTVWVGVFVVCFFNLRFGWNLSGLIVPGYLVPLLILKPWSAVAVIIEALFTYLLIIVFSGFLSKSGRCSSLFGRDRFFAIILFAVVSRLLFDLIIFPELTVFLNNYLKIAFVYKGGLYSIGLVIVALIANQFWNPGFKRGFPQFLITLLISFLLIKYVLIDCTNFRISEVAYLYEDIATSLAASPKAYIILIVTAFLASRMNLLYGWEFGGIVLPALLALQWYYPWKIVSSILEAGIIYGLAVIILKAPIFKNITIEGARKILLFFNIAFGYKMLIGYILPLFIPDVKIMDVYGLGYMLTSLIAIKMYDKKLGLKMTRTTLQTSFIAVIIATIIGYFLLFVPTFINTREQKRAIKLESKGRYDNYDNISEAILKEQIRLYGFIRKTKNITQNELVTFRNAVNSLKNYVYERSDILLTYAKLQLLHLGYRISIVEDKYLLLYESSWKNSRGIYVISLNPKEEVLVEVPLPTQGPGLIESALLTFTNNNFAAFAVAGAKTSLPNQLQSYLINNNTFYNTFCSIFNTRPPIQFFRLDSYIEDLLGKLKKEKNNLFSTNYIYYSNSLSNDKVNKLKNLFPNQKKLDKKPSFLQDNNNTIALFLSPESELNTLEELGSFKLKITRFDEEEKIYTLLSSNTKGFFDKSLSAITSFFKSEASKKLKNKPLTIEKARFIDTQVITPIIELTNNYDKLSDKEKETKLKLISFAAKIVGCTISVLDFETLKCNYIVLTKFGESNEYLGGTFAFKTNNYKPYTIEIINPSDKDNIKLGTYMSLYSKARACFISGSVEPSKFFSYVDDSPTVRSLFNLVNQVIMREIDSNTTNSKDNQKEFRPLVVQINTIKKTDSDIDENYPANTAYISTYHGKYKYSQLDKQEQKIYSFLQECDLDVKFDDGSPLTAGLGAIHSVQSEYIPETKNTNFVMIWLTPKTKFTKESFKKIDAIIYDKPIIDSQKQSDAKSNNKKAVENKTVEKTDNIKENDKLAEKAVENNNKKKTKKKISNTSKDKNNQKSE